MAQYESVQALVSTAMAMNDAEIFTKISSSFIAIAVETSGGRRGTGLVCSCLSFNVGKDSCLWLHVR